MNYISEINAFERWLETNHLPGQSQLLWYKIMMLCNRCGWAEWITVDNQRLMALIQVKREATFIDLRNKLVDAGLLEYQKGKKGSPNRYKIYGFEQISNKLLGDKNNNTFTSEVQSEVYTEVQTEVQTEVYTVAQTVDINKLNKTKLNKKDIPPISPKGEVRVSDRVNYKKIVDCWNTTCPMLPKVQSVSETRKKALRGRVKEHGEEKVMQVIEITASSDFLCGRTGNNWTAGFDWVMKPTNFVKILEGNYTNRNRQEMVKCETDRDKAYEDLEKQQVEWLKKLGDEG
ncbi:MAG: hypothetical protein RSD63_09700 [Eubacterium sp.]